MPSAPGEVDQEPILIRSFTTWFLPVGGDALSIVQSWVTALQTAHDWDLTSRFSRLQNCSRARWRLCGDRLCSGRMVKHPVFRKISCWRACHIQIRIVCATCLHSMTNAYARRPNNLKHSQNLGHEDVMTTLTSYREVSSSRQAELIRGIGHSQRNGGRDPLDDANVPQLLEALAKRHGIGSTAL